MTAFNPLSLRTAHLKAKPVSLLPALQQARTVLIRCLALEMKCYCTLILTVTNSTRKEEDRDSPTPFERRLVANHETPRTRDFHLFNEIKQEEEDHEKHDDIEIKRENIDPLNRSAILGLRGT